MGRDYGGVSLKLSATLAFLIALTLLFWQSLGSAPDSETTAITRSEAGVTEADQSYIVEGQRTQFDETGRVSDTLNIQKARKPSDRNAILIDGVTFRASAKSDSEWMMEATEGVFFEARNELLLRKGVKILEAPSEATLETQAMRIYMDTNKAEGTRPVVLTAKGSRTRGNGFELDLATNTATIIGEVQTRYE